MLGGVLKGEYKALQREKPEGPLKASVALLEEQEASPWSLIWGLRDPEEEEAAKLNVIED